MNFAVEIIVWITYFISLYFSVFLLLVFLDTKELFKKEKSSHRLSRIPLVSIIIPAYNEEKTILRTLQSINNVNYPKDKLQVLVINDGSQDHTASLVNNYIRNKPHFTLLSQKNKGKAASLNKGLRMAQGEFFVCLDADSFVEPFTLRKMLSLYYQQNDPQLAIITPAMKVYQPHNILQKIQWLEYIVMIFFGRLSSHLDALYVAPGPFSLYKPLAFSGRI